MSHQHHAIDYVEFTVLDLSSAKRFYTQAFDWRFRDYGDSYCGIVGPDREIGGMCEGNPKRGGPLVILYSVDLKKSLARVEAAGGEITTPPFDFPGGRRFHFVDPGGNELAVWSEA